MTLVCRIGRLLQGYISANNHVLFENHQFFFLGFDEDRELKTALGKLIRRGMGTIHWELSPDTTMLILNDGCHEALRRAAQIISQQHPNLPPSVSLRWVIESWRHESLLPAAKFPPFKKKKSTATTNILARKPSVSKSISSGSRSHLPPVFRGSLFSLARIAPPDWAVDFDSKDQEAFIRNHGGQILTLKLMDAMRIDSNNGVKRRKCYVVCWGGSTQLELNPILSQLKRYNICDLILVTPIWLEACVTIQRMIVPPDRVQPIACTPQPWPFRRLGKNLRISLTGFQAMEKAAIANLISSCGATFQNEMTRSNTHLVCKEKASGLKLQKAIEWELHIVSVDWLYHVVQHGQNEGNSLDESLQARFSLAVKEDETSTS